jgi:hypothetical protein
VNFIQHSLISILQAKYANPQASGAFPQVNLSAAFLCRVPDDFDIPD